MAGGEWGFFGYLLLLAALLGWLEIRYMARRDREPGEEEKWPEWWVRDPPQSREAAARLGPANQPSQSSAYQPGSPAHG